MGKRGENLSNGTTLLFRRRKVYGDDTSIGTTDFFGDTTYMWRALYRYNFSNVGVDRCTCVGYFRGLPPGHHCSAGVPYIGGAFGAKRPWHRGNVAVGTIEGVMGPVTTLARV